MEQTFLELQEFSCKIRSIIGYGKMQTEATHLAPASILLVIYLEGVKDPVYLNFDTVEKRDESYKKLAAKIDEVSRRM